MKKAFTLIEVLLSVMILTIAISALLQINSQNIKFFTMYKQKTSLYKDASVLTDKIYLFHNKTEKSLYDILKYHYFIDNLDIKKSFENKKFKILYNKDYSTINLMIFKINLDSITLKDKNNSVMFVKVQK